MTFKIQTQYDRSAMTALAKGIRKTLRAKRSRRSHILGFFVVILGILLLAFQNELNLQSVITGIAVVSILIVLFLEDQINGWVALRRGLPGMDHSVTTFFEEGYHSVTALGETTFTYEHVHALAETPEYFLLIFSPNHGQVYAKEGIINGSETDFRRFLEEKTNLHFLHV